MTTEAVKSEEQRLPLEGLHKEAGAQFSIIDGWSEPLKYGDVEAEYDAVRKGGAGLIDLSSRGRIEVTGSEAVAFLNGMITNDMKTLDDGTWMHAAFPNVQGRLVSLVRVLKQGDVFLFDTDPMSASKLLQTLSRFTMAGDFRVIERTADTLCFSLQGRAAAEIAKAAFGEELSGLNANGISTLLVKGTPVRIIKADHTGEGGFDFFVDEDAGELLYKSLRDAGAVPVGTEAREILRIEAGLPRFGVDVDETTVVLETGLDDAVSFTKGCYIGQEIIARIHFRGHVAKKISRLIADEGAKPAPGDKLTGPDGRDAGRITSVTFSPKLARWVAIGLVKYDFLASGTALKIQNDNGAFTVTVADAPGTGSGLGIRGGEVN